MRLYYFDDSGDRSRDPDRPYFVLGGLGIDAADVPELNKRVTRTAETYGMTLAYPTELKFNQVGRHQDRKPSKPHWMWRAGLHDRERRRALVYSVLRTAATIDTVRFIAVAVDTRKIPASHPVIQTALQPLLERVQMDAQSADMPALVMMDEEQADDRALREKLRAGSDYMKFDSIIDSIAFMPSEESPGIQVADLVAGAVSRHFNSGDPGYLRTIWKSFYRGRSASPHGNGMKVYPRGKAPDVPPRVPPWSEVDRKVHTFEFEVFPDSHRLTWNPNGTPSHIWTHDSDSASPNEKRPGTL